MSEEVSFERDIKPLFREQDVRVMRYAFDLSSYADVCPRAELIYERIEDGTMPCDVLWPEEDLALLRAWIDNGKQP
ncbi:hypothetical protein [Amycolatopsis sp. Poz14]|uniref:hypothetical protein n=1 Tax=Amycolatopsis sp. Poz14 TaxID=1447705 RepID=UPI001EE8E6BA|nr:hypothetical protein [Amycolatopsis sp. Poz14]MCG3751977.1 hypothetical protein [Amycolatopsis sp. Poz14]